MSNKRGFESAFDDEMDDAMEGLQQPWGGEPSNADTLFQQANNVLEEMIAANAPNHPPLQFGRPPLDSATASTLHEPPPLVPIIAPTAPQQNACGNSSASATSFVPRSVRLPNNVDSQTMALLAAESNQAAIPPPPRLQQPPSGMGRGQGNPSMGIYNGVTAAPWFSM